MRTIVSVDANGADLQYGPPDRTRLALTLVDDKGKRLPVVLEEGALRQLAALFDKITAEYPGAIRGH